MNANPEQDRVRFTPEFRLVLACLHWPLDEALRSSIKSAAEHVRDWSRVIAIAQRHRVVGLVARAIAQSDVTVPPDAADLLKQKASAQTRHAMLLTAESIRLSRLFQQNHIDPLLLKGATVTMLAYGDLGLRHAKDADVLVPEEQVWQAAEVLRAAGYLPLLDIEEATPERRTMWLRHAKSMDWAHSRNGALLELHWRPTDLPMLDGKMGADTRQQVAITPGTELTTLGQDQLLVYLCAHGAAHGWSRLKWLADVAALLPWEDEAAITSLYRKAAASGTGRAVGQALLLCHGLMAMPLNERLLRDLNDDPVLRMLHRWTLRLLARGDEVAEIYDQPFGTSSVYLSRFLLGSSGSLVLREMQTWAYPPDQLLVSRLPKSFFFLFPLVRVGTWVSQRIRHGGRSAPPTP